MQMNRLSSSDFDKMIIESIDEVYAYDKETGELIFSFDQVKSGEITSEADTVYAEGRQGVQLAAFDRNKTAKFTCENGYVQAGALAAQLGSDIVSADNSEVATFEGDGTTDDFTVSDKPTDVVVCVDGVAKTVTTDYTYTAGTGVVAFTAAPADDAVIEVYYNTTTGIIFEVSELVEVAASDTTVVLSDEVYEVDSIKQIDYIYLLNSDGSKKTAYAYGAAASYDVFTVTTTNHVSTLTLPTVARTGAQKFLITYQSSAVHGKEIINAGDKYSKNVKLVINFVAQEPCGGAKYLMQCVMPNAKTSGSFSLSAGDNPAVQNFEASALLDVCSVNKELFTIKMI